MSGNCGSMFSVGEIALIIGACVFLTALTSGVLFTSLMCRVSWRWGAVDRPDGLLKCHRRPTATLGGVPVFAALIAGMSLLWLPLLRLTQVVPTGVDWKVALGGLLVGALIMLLMGVGDDLRHVAPRTKLLFQMMAAIVLVSTGLVVHRCDFFGVFELHLGALAAPFTVFWLVGSCNAFNFIDGLDGLASGIGVLVAAALAVMGFVSGAYGWALAALAVCGSLLGLLLFNLRPARIFLGDSGSQLIGLLLGALALGTCTSGGSFALPSAGIVLSVPIIDAFLSIIRRYSSGQSPAHGDHQHVHHCLRRRGLSVNQAVLVLWATVVISCLAGILWRYLTGTAVALTALVLVGLELYAGIRLGCVDVALLGARLAGRYRWRITQAAENVTARGTARLEDLWERMKPIFEQMNLDRAVLTLEGVTADGQKQYKTFQWARSEEVMADLLGRCWTRRFSLDGDQQRVAVLRLESAERLRRDEERIEWLLKQIRENMSLVSRGKSRIALETNESAGVA